MPKTLEQIITDPCVPKETATPIEKWGKDHWSLLAYINTLTKGRMDNNRVRTNPKAHPLMVGGMVARIIDKDFKSKPYAYPTRLKDGETIPEHDDWDCLDDLDAHGFVNIISLANCVALVTPKGAKAAQALQAHGLLGGKYSTFVWEEGQ